MAKISVVIPCYNSSLHLDYAIRSVLNQSFSDLDVVLVDDCSTDDSFVKMKRWASVNRKIRFFQTENNSGPGKARNLGIEKSLGDYIAFIDADDVWDATKLEKQVKVLDENADIGLVYCYFRFSNRKNPKAHYHKSYNGNVLGQMLHGPITVPSAVLARSRLVKSAGGFNDKVFVSEDWWLWLKLAEKTKFKCIEEELYIRRNHDNQLSSNNMVRNVQDDYYILTEFLKGSKIGYIEKRNAQSYALGKYALYHRAMNNRKKSLQLYIKSLMLAPWRLEISKAIVVNLFKWEQSVKHALTLSN